MADEVIGTPPPIPPWSQHALVLERNLSGLHAKLTHTRAELAAVDRWLAIVLVLDTLVLLALGAVVLWHLGTS